MALLTHAADTCNSGGGATTITTRLLNISLPRITPSTCGD